MVWIGAILVIVAVSSCRSDESVPGHGVRVFRSEAEPRYWRANDGAVQKHIESPQEIETDQFFYPDKVQVVSSALRILPKKKQRQKRSEVSWKKPKEYEFITKGRDINQRSARLIDSERSSSNYYPEERSYDDYYNRRPSSRRIIYYATLPEIVRRPGEWTPPRPIYNYPPVRDNEITRVHSPIIDVTRVHSGVIDVKDKNRYKSPSLDTPKFTIIDAEPPYNRPNYDRDRYDYDRNRYDNRYNRYDYNRYDYRGNNYIEQPPYRPYYDERIPPNRFYDLPPLPMTVVGKPLDVRPLDPIRDLTTQAPPLSSTHKTSSTQNPISSYERTY